MVDGKGCLGELFAHLRCGEAPCPAEFFAHGVEEFGRGDVEIFHGAIAGHGAGQEERAGGVERILRMAGRDEPLEDVVPERMAGARCEEGVAEQDTETPFPRLLFEEMLRRLMAQYQTMLGEQGVEGAQGFEIEVDIHAAVAMKHEIACRIDTADGLAVPIVDRQKPSVVLAHQFPVVFIGPQAKVPVGMMPLPGDLEGTPGLRYLGVLPSLVEVAGDLGGWGAWHGNPRI